MALRKILVVEDDPAILPIYVRILGKRQVIVLVASDTDTAAGLFLANQDITDVILDGEVPGSMTTTELAAEFRKSSNCRLVAVVGNLEKSSDLVKVCDGSCQKPFEAAKVCELLGLS
ncbi:MAG: response regulator [Patescibacteria group bacterium]